MKSKYISTCRFVLILALMYAVSTGTAAARSVGRLIVSRDPNLGRNLVVNLRLDGRTVANLMQGSRFDHAVWTGRRVLSASAVPKSFWPWTVPNSSAHADDGERAAVEHMCSRRSGGARIELFLFRDGSGNRSPTVDHCELIQVAKLRLARPL